LTTRAAIIRTAIKSNFFIKYNLIGLQAKSKYQF
jgi:hypothetical protein